MEMKVIKKIGLILSIAIIAILFIFVYSSKTKTITLTETIQEKNTYAIQTRIENNLISEEILNNNNTIYEINTNNHAIITSYFGTEDCLIIENEINGYKIDEINTDIFSDSMSLEMIKVSNNIAKKIEKIKDFEKSEILSNDEYSVYITTKDYTESYLSYIKQSDEEKQKSEAIPNKFIIPIENIYSEKTKQLYGNATESSIPTTYDLRNYIDVEVKNQNGLGICYAYATLSSIETHMKLNGGISKNFSEVHAAVFSDERIWRTILLCL